MLIVRQTFQAKYGRGDELVALFKEFNKRMQEDGYSARFRILTDASGPFFTVISEVEAESFTDWEKQFSETMGSSWMSDWFGRMVPLVESGRRDFYNLVE
jgi:hypothetical protein